MSWVQSNLALHVDLAKVPTFRANDHRVPARRPRGVGAKMVTLRNNLTFVRLTCANATGRAMPEDELSSKAERALVTVALSTALLIMCLGSLLYR